MEAPSLCVEALFFSGCLLPWLPMPILFKWEHLLICNSGSSQEIQPYDLMLDNEANSGKMFMQTWTTTVLEVALTWEIVSVQQRRMLPKWLLNSVDQLCMYFSFRFDSTLYERVNLRVAHLVQVLVHSTILRQVTWASHCVSRSRKVQP